MCVSVYLRLMFYSVHWRLGWHGDDVVWANGLIILACLRISPLLGKTQIESEVIAIECRWRNDFLSFNHRATFVMSSRRDVFFFQPHVSNILYSPNRLDYVSFRKMFAFLAEARLCDRRLCVCPPVREIMELQWSAFVRTRAPSIVFIKVRMWHKVVIIIFELLQVGGVYILIFQCHAEKLYEGSLPKDRRCFLQPDLMWAR